MNRPLRILSIKGSVNIDSLSSHINDYLVQKIMDKHQKSFVELVDLNDTPFAKYSLNANNMPKFFEKTESDYWIEQLKNTDLLIISTPMINFNYSSLIKNFLDSIAVANKTFSYKYSEKGGSIGLLTNLKVLIVATQGAPEGWYEFGNHVKNLEGFFNFVGANQIESILIAGTKVEPLKSLNFDEIIALYEAKLEEIATKFDN